MRPTKLSRCAARCDDAAVGGGADPLCKSRRRAAGVALLPATVFSSTPTPLTADMAASGEPLRSAARAVVVWSLTRLATAAGLPRSDGRHDTCVGGKEGEEKKHQIASNSSR